MAMANLVHTNHSPKQPQNNERPGDTRQSSILKDSSITQIHTSFGLGVHAPKSTTPCANPPPDISSYTHPRMKQTKNSRHSVLAVNFHSPIVHLMAPEIPPPKSLQVQHQHFWGVNQAHRLVCRPDRVYKMTGAAGAARREGQGERVRVA